MWCRRRQFLLMGIPRTYAFNRLGFRVPAVFVSPLLDPGAAHQVYDHTSLLKLAAGKWPGVKPLGLRAQAANDPMKELTWREQPRTDMPPAPVAPDIEPAHPLPGVKGFKASIYGLSHYLESLIDHPAHRNSLMARAHEALDDSHGLGRLVTDRVEGFFAHHGHSPGLLRPHLRRMEARDRVRSGSAQMAQATCRRIQAPAVATASRAFWTVPVARRKP